MVEILLMADARARGDRDVGLEGGPDGLGGQAGGRGHGGRAGTGRVTGPTQVRQMRPTLRVDAIGGQGRFGGHRGTVGTDRGGVHRFGPALCPNGLR